MIRLRAPGPRFLGSATALAVNHSLQVAMLLAKAKLLPDLRPTALDQILAVGILPEAELNDNSCVAPRPCSSTRRMIASLT